MKVLLIQLHVKFMFGRNILHCRMVDAADTDVIVMNGSLAQALAHAEAGKLEIVNAQAILTQAVNQYGVGA